MSDAVRNVVADPSAPSQAAGDERTGFLLVFLAALCWSLGGMIARFVEADDPWTSVFWRSFWASSFLFGYMVWRDGLSGTVRLFRAMGWPGLVVAGCFAFATTAFVLAVRHTTVANVLLMQAGAPLIAALLAFAFFRERVSGMTWIAISAVIVGVAIMVSDSFGGGGSLIGDALALGIVCVFSVATVLMRRFAHVRMTPAMCLGTAIAGVLSFSLASGVRVSSSDFGLLFAFGAINLGMGLAFYATGARMVPAAYAALIATFETLFGPIWVWLAHSEVPSSRTLAGGSIVFVALVVHIALGMRRSVGAHKPGTSGVASPT